MDYKKYTYVNTNNNINSPGRREEKMSILHTSKKERKGGDGGYRRYDFLVAHEGGKK